MCPHLVEIGLTDLPESVEVPRPTSSSVSHVLSMTAWDPVLESVV